MKNIYTDDSFNQQSQDIFSQKNQHSENTSAPYRPKPLEQVQGNTPVRSAKQAPPPIKKPESPSPAYSRTPPYPPQPVYYPPQGYPQPYPMYGQPPVTPVSGQPVYYYPQPGMYPPQMPVQQPPLQQPKRSDAPVTDAGTRVLYQSPDFDKPEASSPKTIGAESFEYEDYETLPESYRNNSLNYKDTPFEVSEVSLPSKNVTPIKTTVQPEKTSFKVDEMEIGVYELNAMTVNRTAKATGIDSPDKKTPQPEETIEVEDYESNFLEDIYPTEEAEPQNTAEDESAEQAPEEAPTKGKKKLKKAEIVRRCVLVISIIAIIVSAGFIINRYRLKKNYSNNQKGYADLLITEPSEESTTQNTTTKADENNKQTTKPTTTKPTTTRPLSPAEQWQIIKDDYPNINFPENMQLKYAKFYATNQDFAGYLYADGSDLETPVVQTTDNEYYIDYDFYGDYTSYACPFVDFNNNIESLDTNTIIYGHHMRDGSIFGTLDQYQTIEGYREAPVITFNTLYKDYSWKIIAVFLTNSYPKEDNGYLFNYLWTNLSNRDLFSAYLNEISQRSYYDTGVDVLPTDKLLTLSTCSKVFNEARFVVVARLVRPGESAKVNTDLAVENPNPRFPQAYYDEEGLENPYADAYKWYPG